MTDPPSAAAEHERLAERLAGITIAELDAMTDQEVAEFMGAPR